MKYSLHLRTASPQYLKKADEILIEYRDRKAIPDYTKHYPNATITLEIKPEEEWDPQDLKDYYILCKSKFCVCLPNMRDSRLELLKAGNIPFFWGYTINTFWELQAVTDLGACQARIGAPIFFESDKLKRFSISKRVCANVAHEGYLPNVEGITGSWIRPEDVETYSDTFDLLEFADCTDRKEEALYRIYAEDHEWPGRIDTIITNISTEAVNRMVPKEFANRRKNCGQRCASKSPCRICHHLLYLANPSLIQEYIETPKTQ